MAMTDFMVVGLASLLLVILCSALFYEILAHVWLLLPKLDGRPRLQIVFTLFATFFGHTVAVWLFGVSYYLLDTQFDLGSLKGNAIVNSFFQYIYFSCVTYSSLGLGDIYPTGGLQLLMGVEAIVGLILIGWSIAFTYLVTQQYLVHRSGKDHPLLPKN